MRQQRMEKLLITCRVPVGGCWLNSPPLRFASTIQIRLTTANMGPTSYQQVFHGRIPMRNACRFSIYGDSRRDQLSYARPLTTATVLKKVVFDYYRMKHQRLA